MPVMQRAAPLRTTVKLVRLWAIVYWFFMIPLWKQQRLTYSREHRGFKYLVFVERFRYFLPLSQFCYLFWVGRLASPLIVRIIEIIIILNCSFLSIYKKISHFLEILIFFAFVYRSMLSLFFNFLIYMRFGGFYRYYSKNVRDKNYYLMLFNQI